MKVKHYILAALALICCTTLLTACGSDDENDSKPANDNARTYAALWYYPLLTNDMLDYFNIVITTTNGEGKTASQVVTKDGIKNGVYEVTVTGKLPCQLKVETTVTAKEDVDFTKVETLQYYTKGGYNYQYAFYNAQQKLIEGELHTGTGGSLSPLTIPNNEKVQEYVKKVNEEGRLNHTFTITFDKDGNKVQ